MKPINLLGALTDTWAKTNRLDAWQWTSNRLDFLWRVPTWISTATYNHSCWRASFFTFCLGGRPVIYTIYKPYISFIYSMYIYNYILIWRAAHDVKHPPANNCDLQPGVYVCVWQIDQADVRDITHHTRGRLENTWYTWPHDILERMIYLTAWYTTNHVAFDVRVAHVITQPIQQHRDCDEAFFWRDRGISCCRSSESALPHRVTQRFSFKYFRVNLRAEN